MVGFKDLTALGIVGIIAYFAWSKWNDIMGIFAPAQAVAGAVKEAGDVIIQVGEQAGKTLSQLNEAEQAALPTVSAVPGTQVSPFAWSAAAGWDLGSWLASLITGGTTTTPATTTSTAPKFVYKNGTASEAAQLFYQGKIGVEETVKKVEEERLLIEEGKAEPQKVEEKASVTTTTTTTKPSLKELKKIYPGKSDIQLAVIRAKM